MYKILMSNKNIRNAYCPALRMDVNAVSQTNDGLPYGLVIPILSLFQMIFKPLSNLSQKVVAGVATKDTVVAIGIIVFLEVLVSLNQGLCIFKCVLGMHIVIGSTMDDE